MCAGHLSLTICDTSTLANRRRELHNLAQMATYTMSLLNGTHLCCMYLVCTVAACCMLLFSPLTTAQCCLPSASCHAPAVVLHAGCCHASWRLSRTQGLPLLKLQFNSVASIGSCIFLCVCAALVNEGSRLCLAIGSQLVMHVCTPSGNNWMHMQPKW